MMLSDIAELVNTPLYGLNSVPLITMFEQGLNKRISSKL